MPGDDAQGPEIWFYHLEAGTLEQTLTDLLERSGQRGWRAYVHGQDEDSLEGMSRHLWSYAPKSFLAHGREGEPHPEHQPVLLGESGVAVNNPHIYLSVAPVNLPDLDSKSGLERCLIIFQGRDERHLHWARELWKQLKRDGRQLAYWKQNDHGKWEKMQ